MDVIANEVDYNRQLTSTPTKSSCVLDDWRITEVTCPAWLEDVDSGSEPEDTLLLTKVRNESTLSNSFHDEVCDELDSEYFDDASDVDDDVLPVEEDNSFSLCTCDFCLQNPACSEAHHESDSDLMQ